MTYDKLLTAILVLSFGLSNTVLAEKGDGKRRHGPPPVAFEACEAQVEGDACSFVGRRDDTLTGMCKVKRENLVCVPDRRHKEKTPEDETA